jgi:NitT/TauT family transport system permease protein
MMDAPLDFAGAPPPSSIEARAASARAAARARARWQARAGDVLLPLAALAVILLAWQFVLPWLGVGAWLVPPPARVAEALVGLANDDAIVGHIAVTLQETLFGFACALLAAVVLGGLVAQSRLVERTVYGWLVALQTCPKVALAPLFVAWFGFGPASKVAVAGLISFFPMFVNVIVGLKSADAGKVDVMRALSASEWQIFRFVRLPSALPYLLAGVDVAIVFALTGAIVGEFVGANAGLGYQMLIANSRMEVHVTFAVLVLLASIGVLLHGAVELARRRLLAWMPVDDAGTGKP